LKAIGKDRRIGLDYLKPGLGFGGPCFPRDNRLFQYVAQSVGVEAALSRATDKINEDVNQRLLETVLAHCPEGGSVGVLGLAYKPFTAVVDRSPGMWLCERLAAADRQVFAHDYLAGVNASSVLPPDRVQICSDPAEILQNGCQAIVVTCPWPEYKDFFQANADRLSDKGTVIVDPWRLLDFLVATTKDLRHVTTLISAGNAVSPEVAAHA
jgi:UDPglucose 6-dehydrogenase